MNNGSTVWRLSKSRIDRELSENANITEIEDRKMEDSCCWLLAVSCYSYLPSGCPLYSYFCSYPPCLMVASCCCWFDGSPVTLIQGLSYLIGWLHLFFHIAYPNRIFFFFFNFWVCVLLDLDEDTLTSHF